MADPALALQKAVRDALRNSAPLTALIGTRVYDRVPQGTAFPFVQIGEDFLLGDDTYGDFTEATVTVHVYSRAVGKVEAKTIAGVIRDVLAVQLRVAGFQTVEWRFLSTRSIPDRDGLTEHLVMEFEYYLGEL